MVSIFTKNYKSKRRTARDHRHLGPIVRKSRPNYPSRMNGRTPRWKRKIIPKNRPVGRFSGRVGSNSLSRRENRRKMQAKGGCRRDDTVKFARPVASYRTKGRSPITISRFRVQPRIADRKVDAYVAADARESLPGDRVRLNCAAGMRWYGRAQWSLGYLQGASAAISMTGVRSADGGPWPVA